MFWIAKNLFLLVVISIFVGLTPTGCRTIRNYDTLLSSKVSFPYNYVTEDDLSLHSGILKKITHVFFKKLSATSTTENWKNSMRWGDCSWNKFDTCELNYLLPLDRFGPVFVRVEISHLVISELESTLLKKDNPTAFYIPERRRLKSATLSHFVNTSCIFDSSQINDELADITDEYKEIALKNCKDNVIIEYYIALQDHLRDHYDNQK